MHEPTLGNEKKLYSDARHHIPGVTAFKQSQEETLLSDTYSDARCHIPGMTMEIQSIHDPLEAFSIKVISEDDSFLCLWSQISSLEGREGQ